MHTQEQTDNPPQYQAVTIKTISSKQSDYLFCSILNLVCCCFCLGLPALIYSIKAREQFRSGFSLEAKDNAKIAKNLNIFGTLLGLGLYLLFLLLRLDII